MEDSVALVEGVPDGMLLADWAERNDVGRTTSYAFIKILRAMGIELRSVRRKGSAKPSQFLGGQALEAMNHLLMQHRDGRSLAQLEVDHCTAITHTPAPPPPEPLARHWRATEPERDHLDYWPITEQPISSSRSHRDRAENGTELGVAGPSRSIARLVGLRSRSFAAVTNWGVLSRNGK
jgi:hypothetical protein